MFSADETLAAMSDERKSRRGDEDNPAQESAPAGATGSGSRNVDMALGVSGGRASLVVECHRLIFGVLVRLLLTHFIGQ